MNAHRPVTKVPSSIMVVEDAPDFQTAMVFSLLMEPHFKDIHIASSGEEAMEVFLEVCPELVFLDFRLPGINGLETAKLMKEQRPDVKIVLVTAYAEAVLERAAREAHVDAVCPKASISLSRVQQILGEDL